MSVTCEICGKEFKNSQGLRGHKTFVHQITTTQEPPARLATEQELGIVEEKLELLYAQVEQLDELLSNLVSKVDRQAEQVSKLAVQVNSAQAKDQKLTREITKFRYDLGQLGVELKRLSRFVQYEFAGINNDIIWGMYLDSPELKSNLRIRPRHR